VFTSSKLLLEFFQNSPDDPIDSVDRQKVAPRISLIQLVRGKLFHKGYTAEIVVPEPRGEFAIYASMLQLLGLGMVTPARTASSCGS